MARLLVIPLIVLFILLIGAAHGFAAVAISEVQTPFNFLDVGNATPEIKTIWANIVNTGGGTLSFVNLTFIFPFGINPQTPGACNTTQQNVIGGSASANGTFNLTHQTCSIGYINLSNGVLHNVTLNVTANMSALAHGHIARGTSARPAVIYAIANASNGSGIVSQATQHNATSFWINPKPYAYSSNEASSNGTVYIMDFNQTRKGYIVDVPIMIYNTSTGAPETGRDAFANIMYMNATFMDAPTMVDPFFMEMFSYNLTFRIVLPFTANDTSQVYYINSPATAGNQTLIPLLRQQFTMPGMMGQNFTMSLAVPAQSGFDIYYGVNSSNSGIYSIGNLTTSKGITITFVPGYSSATPMLIINATNASSLNNTDISILFTLMDTVNSIPSSPIYVRAQQLAGFDMTAPPKFGDNITNTYIINISNSLDNYTLSNLSLRFMLPINVSILNGSNAGSTHNITNMDNATFKHSSSKATYAYSAAWSGATNYTKTVNIIDRLGPTQGTTVQINFTFVDVVLSSQFNNWAPGGQISNSSFATFNLTTFMSFPVMNQSNNTPGIAGSTNSYNATIQMPMKGRLNLTDKVPGMGTDITDYNITMDGIPRTKENQNVTIGSLLLNNVDSGSHTITVSYVVPTATATPSGGTTGGGAAAGAAAVAATITSSSPAATVSDAIPGTMISISLPITTATGEAKTEAHTATVISIIGSLVKIKFTSTPVYVDVNVGETKYADINGDGINDVKVTVNSVSAGVANISFELLSVAKGETKKAYIPSVPETPAVQQPTAEPGVTTVPAAVEKPAVPSSTFMLLIVLAVLVIAGVYYFYSGKK